MLVAAVLINGRLIDQLYMWNQGEVKNGKHKYLVWLDSDRFGEKDIKKEVWHKREDSWQVLVTKSLKALKQK